MIAIKVSAVRRLRKDTLQGCFSIELPGVGLIIKDCSLHERGGKPCKPYTTPGGGEQSWTNIVDFADNNLLVSG
jgi:hypothetical protein